MRILLAGSSGFLGTALRDRLARESHDVVRLVRGEAVSVDESPWDPYRGVVDRQVVENADVVVNLAGSPLAGNPHATRYRRSLRESRVRTTELLARTIATCAAKPALLAQNGTSFYGDRGEEVLAEDAATAPGSLLTEITREWQAATEPARAAGARVCVMRSGAVLHRRGGAFRPLSLLFRAGLGGPLGDGAQYFPIISLQDWVGAVVFLATHQHCHGVYNLTGPDVPTNAEFTVALGRMLHRPTALRVPAWPVRRALGDLAPELLGSVRAEPVHLRADGYAFEDPTLNAVLAAALTG